MSKLVISAAPLGQAVGGRGAVHRGDGRWGVREEVFSLTPRSVDDEGGDLFESAVAEAAHNSLDVVEALERGR